MLRGLSPREGVHWKAQEGKSNWSWNRLGDGWGSCKMRLELEDFVDFKEVFWSSSWSLKIFKQGHDMI